jgi:hypothetical protein
MLTDGRWDLTRSLKVYVVVDVGRITETREE